MKCPVCPDATLAMMSREGVEIDYCPTCRGVWLDRGELDKILERAAKPAPSAPSPALEPRRQEGSSGWHRQQGHYGHKRKSWLSELFD